MRFNIDINKSLSKYPDNCIIYNILKIDSDNNYNINSNLIVEHDIEIDNKMKQIDNEYIKLNLFFSDELFQIYKNYE